MACILIIILFILFLVLFWYFRKQQVEKIINNAYNGKYYPAIVGVKTIYGADHDGITANFMLYPYGKIVTFDLYYKEQSKNKIEKEEEYLFFKNALVYECMKGVWTWKTLC